MARKATVYETIKKNTVLEMKSLNIFKREYDNVIDVYCSLLERYLAIKKEIKQKDYEERTPICISEENMRKDLLRYANELGLTPTGLKKINEKSMGTQKTSVLAKALSSFG